MDIAITCNTDDAILFENIAHNSMRDLQLVQEVPAHNGHAVIVGSGPSVENHIDQIKWRQGLGQTIFALNGASLFLSRNVVPHDYQVIMDARRANINLLNTASNITKLLASQCDPQVFDQAIGEVRIWHPAYEGLKDHLVYKEDQGKIVTIGGGTSVGLSALCLAYVMGYRKFHLFGYDSSHKDNRGHAYPQPMNDADPTVNVTVFGKTFKSSLTMAWQAELFPKLCDKLIDLGCMITIDGDGLLPFIVKESARRAQLRPVTEKEKYEAIWSCPEYRITAPGENSAETFIKISGVEKNDVVFDFGCGTGRGARRIHELTGCEFILVDFAKNCLDEYIGDGDWCTMYWHDLSEPMNLKGKLGYCTDVMEHIPHSQVDMVIRNIMNAADQCFFQISLVDDVCGELIGQPLHLSVHNFDWWYSKFQELGYCISNSENLGDSAYYYVTR